jgi:hypothetical protein
MSDIARTWTLRERLAGDRTASAWLTIDGDTLDVVAVERGEVVPASRLAGAVSTREQDACADCGHRWDAHRGDGVCLHCGCEARLLHHARGQ